jgi:hypothetical protein
MSSDAKSLSQEAEVRSGSVASHPDVRDAPGVSALPPIATASVPHNETLLCANRVPTHRSKPYSVTRLLFR